ncbi:DNA polymerase III subunit alpha [Vagococcus xieshaowenii]|uniref:DNA polymerase III subunit alpha n=1 Tax=Vagococcus xieshaowenii TaxID=2562451 RepID=A0AAJ5EFK2_9ENTE|nr:DNA polymerase III subunit alpha [Vagococcus xieshaowenii]QCA28474.1 DNA polymerase III subunit alpha [Vagococcus xieshaowenii]TFZ42771.1 DNA polymerase III subunit alpha [Vagococcus xieshaowenii]
MENVQLYNQTAFSLLKSTNRIQDFVKQAKKLGYSALGIADINTMSGVADFYRACKSENIHPIIGVTIEYTVETLEHLTFKLVFYAKNKKGYQHLIKLSTLKMMHQHQAVFLEQLLPYFSDLVVVIPAEESQLNYHLKKDNQQAMASFISSITAVADNASIYGGVANYLNDTQLNSLQGAYSLLKIPMVAFEDSRYLLPSDHFSVEILHHIDLGTRLESLEYQEAGSYYLQSPESVWNYYDASEHLDAYKNAHAIAEACQFEMDFSQSLLPHFDTPDNLSAGEYLRQLCFEFLPQRIPEYDERYVERLEKELGVIHEMGFDDYFLIVWDVMRFAEEQEVVTGAGRGSAAGALVSYVLSITDVDPIKYHLLFERFLNIERNSMPDIDIDIPDNRRDEILHYVHDKYGDTHMAQIATFGTMAAKMVLRDVCRVFGLSQNEASEWSNAVPNVLKITLNDAFNQSKKLQKLVESSERNQLIFKVARQLEGLPRHVSTHAAGVVISDIELTDVVPLQEGSEDIPLTQFAMGNVEAIGLLKMDFLGLRNLSIIDDALRHIRRTTGTKLTQKMIPMNDPKTLALFKKGQTSGVFQFESAGIRNVLRKVSPESIEDIAAVNALYRPGPMENIETFVKRKHGQEDIQYPHESLKDILDVTYGIIVYQEQIMQVAAKMANFTLGQADILQRAVSKKVKRVLDEQKQHFIDGSVSNGYTLEVAEEVYQYIEKFANYGFNRSHAMAYSFVGYQMAYLKVHYPAAFFAALLHSVRHNLEKIKEYIADARKYGVVIKGPTINRSSYSFSLTKNNKILFGFSSLKGLRRDFVKELIAERKENGPYTSFDNFLIRNDNKWLKKEWLTPLIQIGAFDEIEKNRRELMKNLDGNIANVLISGGSFDMLATLELKESQLPDYSLEEKLTFEEELLGAYVSGHPVNQYKSIKLVKQAINISQSLVGKHQTFLVYLKKIREIRTKKGETMAFLEVSDESGDLSLTVFPSAYRKFYSQLKEHNVYLVSGKVEESRYNQERQLLVEQLEPIETLSQQIGSSVCYLRLSKDINHPKVLAEIKELIKDYKGNNPVILYNEQTNQRSMLNQSLWIEHNQEVRTHLVALLGEKNVVFDKGSV